MSQAYSCNRSGTANIYRAAELIEAQVIPGLAPCQNSLVLLPEIPRFLGRAYSLFWIARSCVQRQSIAEGSRRGHWSTTVQYYVRRAVRMMSCRNGTVVGIVALAWSTTAFAGTHECHRDQRKSQRDATAVPPAAIGPRIKGTAKGSSLRIARVRLDPPPPGEKENSAVLKFQLSNGISTTLADIVLEVSIVEELWPGHMDKPRRILAGPFTIRGTIVLDPGHTADYEIFLRNISATCRCAANVRVLSFRPIEDSGSVTPRQSASDTSHDTQDR